MNTIQRLFIVSVVALALIGCSEESPSVRVTNEYSKTVSVVIRQRSENTYHMAVEPGQTSIYEDIQRGRCDVTATTRDEFLNVLSFELVLPAESDHNYTIIMKNTTPLTLTFTADKK